MTTAPPARRVDQFGRQPTAFFRALSEADNLCREVDRVRELEIRLEEVTAERNEWMRRALAACSCGVTS